MPPCNKSFLIFMVLVLNCGVSYAKTDLITSRTVSFSTLLNFYEQPVTEIIVKVTPEKELFIDYESIRGFLERRLLESILNEIDKKNIDGYVDSLEFEGYDIFFVLNSETLETNVTIPTELLIDSGLYIFETQNDLYNYQESSFFGGYINYFISGAHFENDNIDNTWQSINTFETALRYDKFNFFNDFSFDVDSDINDFYRLGSQLTYDFPDEGTRITLGDYAFQTFGFQGGESLLGININRNFGIIPTKNVRPITSQRFVIDRPSTVEVLIDGILIRSLRLAPGAYDIRDIPLTTGVNYIELVITDPSGRREVLTFNIASGVNLLAEGEFEYSFSVGVSSEQVDTSLEYDTDDYIISAGIEYGVLESLTLGANTQARENIVQIGTSVGFATNVGLFGLEGAASQHEFLDEGYALRANYDAFYSSDVHSFNAQYEYLSERFVSIADNQLESFIENETGVQHRLDAFYNYRFSNDFNVGLSGNIRYLYNQDYEYALTTSLSGSWLNSTSSWSLRATYEDDDDIDSDEWRFFVSTSIPIDLLWGNNHRMSTSYDTDNSRSQARYSYNNNAGAVGGVGVFALVENNEDNNVNGNVSVDYTGNRYVLTFDHDSLVDLDNDYSTRNQIGVQGALAFSGSSAAIGRPIGDAFAIISPHSSLDDSPVILNPEYDGSYAVKSDGLGPLLMPDIASYQAQRIDYDVENLPIGYDLGEGGFSINPLHSSSYNFTIGSDANITAMGYFYDSNEKPVPLTEGTATHQQDSEFTPVEFFTNSKGRFAITGLKPGIYEVKLYSVTPIEFLMTIPENEGNIIRLGDIRAGK